MNAQFVRFVLVGAVAAGANIGSRALFGIWLDYIASVGLAFLVGLSTAYLLNRSWVFAPSGRPWIAEAGYFVVVNLLGLAQTVLLSWMLARLLFPALGLAAGEPWDTVAHGIGVVAPMVSSFIGHKYLTFRKHRHA